MRGGARRLALAGPVLLITLITLMVCGLFGFPAAPAGAVATPAPTPAAPPSVGISITELTPRAPRRGDELVLTGTVRNLGPAPLRALVARVEVGSRLDTRAALARADATAPTYRDRGGVELPDLPPGVQVPLQVAVPVDALRLGLAGVYPVQLEVRGALEGSRQVLVLGQQPTYLPWFGDTEVDPLRIAWLWPLTAPPTRVPRGAGEVMVDDTLTGALAQDGRLGRALASARSGQCRAEGCTPVPVTLAVDPDLLLSASAMTGPYEVLAPPGTTPETAPGAGGVAATSWLSSLRSASSDGDLLALPYADPDVGALTRGGGELAADVATARTYGETVTREVLGASPLTSVAFPPPGPVSDAAFDTLTTGSTLAVVLGADTLTAAAPGRSTPGTRVALPARSASGEVTGLVLEQGLSDLLTAPSPGGPRLAEQRWLVETAMIAAELPARGRTLLVAPARQADLDPAVAGAAVADTGRVPWLCPVRLRDVVAQAERCGERPASSPAPGTAPSTAPSTAPDRSSDLVQPEPGAPGLSPGLLAEVTAVRRQAVQLTGAVVVGGTEAAQALRARMQRAWLRAESSAWRGDEAGGRRIVDLLAGEVSGLRSRVAVLPGTVLLTSRTGRVTVTVVNQLDLPVSVSVRLRAPADARLETDSVDLLEVPAQNTVQVAVGARTLTSGRFAVQAQLVDRDGAALGPPQELLVRSTRYGTVALAVTGLGAAVLFVAAGLRIVRRARRSRQGAAA